MNGCCIMCGRKLSQKPLFILKNAPGCAQDIPDAGSVMEDEGMTLGLHQCAGCGLVQFDCMPVPYYRDVIRAGGFSTTMTELRRRQYSDMIEKYHLEGKRFLEVGCGRGEFLKVLEEFPVKVYGMEHKAGLVRLAQKEGHKVWREFPETADQIFLGGKAWEVPEAVREDFAGRSGQTGNFDVFLSFNFLEHQPDPSVMLRAIRHNLAEGGMGLVTVPALEYIVEQGSYYELIRDHIAYYSFGALRRLMELNGFEVLEEELMNRDTIAMVVKKAPSVSAVDGNGAMQASGAGQERDAGTYMAESLVRGYERTQQEVSELTDRLQRDGRTLALWGAGHQGFTLAATSCLGRCARYIIDSAPFKQGRFAPASHLPIVAPEHFAKEPVDVILIIAPGYTEEIAASIRDKFGEDSEILAIRTDHMESFCGKRKSACRK